MFTTNPRGWRARVYTKEEFDLFRQARAASGVQAVVVHSPYLPNLCTSNEALYQQSLNSLVEDLSRCERLGAEYLVIHPGAFSPESDRATGIRRLVEAIRKGLSAIPGKSRVLIENMAGGGRRVGSQFSEIAEILRGIDKPERTGVCFDTCHALAGGYDVSDPRAIPAVLEEFQKTIGLENIHVFHVNDSKSPLGSHLDRHEHLGKGHVGINGLTALFHAADFENRVFILETPKDSPRADLVNLKALHACLMGVAAA